MEQAAMEQRIRGTLEALIAIPGYLGGCSTIEDCMQDAGLRAFLGHGLLDGLFPALDGKKEDWAKAAMAVLQAAEHDKAPLFPYCIRGTALFEQWLLPCLPAQETQEAAHPPCFVFALSCLILYFSGAKQTEEGYLGLTDVPYASSADGLSAFARLSPDMPAETLAYAALSDCDIWHADLRTVDGLADCVTACLRDLQILGLRATMKKCCP